MTAEIGYEWLPKAAVYVLVQGAIGLSVARSLLRPGGSATAVWLEARLARAAIVVSLLILLALATRAWVHTATAFGWSEAWSAENLRVIAVDSRWGARWQAQMGAAALLAVAAVAARRGGAAWLVHGAAALGTAATLPLLGHAGGSSWRHALHAAHIIGAGLWLGTLAVVTTVAVSHSAPRDQAADVSALVGRFSPWAVAASTVVLASGAIAAVVYVGSVEALIGTIYGLTLIVKLVVVSLIVGCGWRNWQSVRRGRMPSRAVMLLESAAALAAIVVTAVLSEQEHP